MYFYTVVFRLLVLIKFVYCNKYLLPDTVKPIFYNIIINSVLDEGTENDFQFYGEELICVKVFKPTNEIILHAKNLHISEVTVKSYEVTSVKCNKELDFLHILLNETLIVNNTLIIKIKFNGIINTELTGFYRSSYIRNNKKEWLAVTKFEPIYARTAFPCFDEPAFKAKYKLNLGHRTGLFSISNMPLESSKQMGNDYVLDVFKISVPMSSYLVAYMISDFEYVTSPPGLSNTEFRIWARSDSLHQAEFAKITGPRGLTFFENYFHIPYPLPKQDMVAVPDFISGAMENWGLITYRESTLLYDKNVTLKRHKENIARVICHELAHQWFGNLVTMKWWNDLWLNEGFATYMAVLCVNNLFPDWNYAERSFQNIMNHVWVTDGFKYSIPLSANVINPANIDELFGAVAYKKGSSILRMLETSLGADVLKNGVTGYLNKFKYSNAKQDDLWDYLNYFAHNASVIPKEYNIKTMMNSWTIQTGYPILHVIRNYHNGSVTLIQERFMWNSVNDENKKYCYWIPFTYTTKSELNFEDTKPVLWIPCPREPIHINEFANSNDWVICNIKKSGLYRVNYDMRNWNLLRKQLSTNIKQIDVYNRRSILDDLTALTDIGVIQYEFTFKFLNYLEKETSRIPWLVALNFLKDISIKLQRSKGYCIIKKYMHHLLKAKYVKSGGLFKRNNCVKLFSSFACRFGVQECLAHAKHLLNQFMSNPNNNPILKENRPLVYCYGVKNGGIEEWNFLWSLYLQSTVELERNMLLKSLGCANDKTILKKYLHTIFGENIRNQDVLLVFTSVANNPVGYTIARDLLYKCGKKFLPKGRRITAFLSAIIAPIISENEKARYLKFIEKHAWIKTYAKMTVQRSIEKVYANIKWFKRNYDHLMQILNVTNYY